MHGGELYKYNPIYAGKVEKTPVRELMQTMIDEDTVSWVEYSMVYIVMNKEFLLLIISAPESSHMRESCYSFSYHNLRNYLFINKFRSNKKVILKIIK